MFNLDNITNENNIDHNRKCLYILDHPYSFIIGSSGSEKTNALLNLIKEPDNDNLIDKIYLCAKDLNKPKYQFLIKRREDAGINHLNAPKAFIVHSNTMDGINSNTNGCKPSRKRKVLIAFDDMIADIMTNKNCQDTIK